MSKSNKPIDISSLTLPINKRLILKRTFIPFVFFLIVCAVLLSDIRDGWLFLLGVFVVMLFIAVINYSYYKVIFYKLENDCILIKRHPINPQEVIIEYSRIKDIVIYRDLLDRIFGLYELKFEMD